MGPVQLALLSYTHENSRPLPLWSRHIRLGKVTFRSAGTRQLNSPPFTLPFVRRLHLYVYHAHLALNLDRARGDARDAACAPPADVSHGASGEDKGAHLRDTGDQDDLEESRVAARVREGDQHGEESLAESGRDDEGGSDAPRD